MKPGSSVPTRGERLWRRAFFFLSATLAACALLQLGAGRFASGLANVGLTFLLISLIPQFPFVRAIIRGGARQHPDDELLRDLQRVRTQTPWAETMSAAGWLFLGASLLLRAFGVG